MHKQALFFLCGLLFLSCGENKLYDQFQSVENLEWSAETNFEFIVSNTDTISKRNVFINIRNNKNYEFSSLFLIAKIEFPSGYKLVDTLEYEMTNAQGKFLGQGFSDVKENKLFLRENVVLSEKGDYKFLIQQATRSINDIDGKNPLKGITDVGLSIEKVK
ncbi:gliding motility lipoprotein GldH [Lutibacter sp.]|jgi:gliding motility-associated lipoprotein GldH|uniref:gliding motility lipoprotein GldH n=1 Tax=Lutibacter sp. TaxID=1925666 RepID=UPI001A274151|nr:gliding motility lipoprotein GldH [Lutibacter sp.]MBI9041089.1 gliding motility lipoprotein GldH [Lutibacter sp.]